MMFNNDSLFCASIENAPNEMLASQLFKVDGHRRTTNAYFSYVLATFAKDFFKNCIDYLDKEGVYMRRTPTLEVLKKDIDEELLKFEKELSKLEEAKKYFASAHPDYYRMQTCLPSSKSLEIYLPSKAICTNVQDAIQGYKAANDFLKHQDPHDLDVYCTELRPMLNIEHKAEYDEYVEKQRIALKIPSRKELEESLPKKETIKKRLCLDRSAHINQKPSDMFISAFLTNMTL